MKRLISIIVLSIASVVMAFAQISDMESAIRLRLIREEFITLGELRAKVERRERQAGRSFNNVERSSVLDEMINECIIIQAAERDRITVSDDELNQQIQQTRDMLNQQAGRTLTDTEYAAAVMNETDLDISGYREQLRRQMIIRKYTIIKGGLAGPTEAELVNEYNLLRLYLTRPETVRISMIQIPFGNDSTRARQIAENIVSEMGGNPARFDELAARALSPGANFQAGDVGYMYRNQETQESVGQDFMDTAFSLRVNEVSSLIEVSNAFQIIKITEKYEQKILELDDLFHFGTRVTVRDYIADMMFEQRQLEALASIISELRGEASISSVFLPRSW